MVRTHKESGNLSMDSPEWRGTGGKAMEWRGTEMEGRRAQGRKEGMGVRVKITWLLSGKLTPSVT